MYRGWTQTDYQNKYYNINQKWLQHVQRMDTNRLPNQALQYKPKVATTCTEMDTNRHQNKHYNIDQKWLQHVQRMDTNRLPKQALLYKPKVATTCTEDGHKQTTKTSTTI